MTSRAVLDGLLNDTGASAQDILSGRRWPGTPLTPSSGIILAQAPGGAVAAPRGFLIPGPGTSMAGNVPVTRLPGGALRMGGVTIMAEALLRAIDAAHERAATEAAITRFSLDRTQAADILAASAYVWTRRMAPRMAPRLPWSDTALEQAAQAVMHYERTHPGTRDLALGGDYTAQQALGTLIEAPSWGAVDYINERRISQVSNPALSTDSAITRAIVGPQTMQDWRAHHFIPFGVMARQPPPVQTAIAASGWRMDSAENLIALPANYATFLAFPNQGILPWHAGAHPLYDADVAVLLSPVTVNGPTMGAPGLRLALAGTEATLKFLITSTRKYHERIS